MPANKNISAEKSQGFTLIELSIVLVIIGLIVGGVLVGQDLIRAAEIRATVSQIEKYNSAVNTFRTKYNGIPGDLSSTAATNFGMTTRSGAAGHGDGDGLLEACSSAAVGTSSVSGCETLLFWNDLSFANLSGNSFNTATDALVTIAAGTQASYFPPAKLGRGNYVTVFAGASSDTAGGGGLNFYEITGITSTATSTGAYTLTTSLTPTEAFNMDSKLDDGLPTTGIVRAMRSTSAVSTLCAPGANSGAGDGCCGLGGSDTTSANVYTTTTATLAATQACQLRFRFN